MEGFIFYWIKSAVWLSGFAAVYYVFLRNERYFNLKRIYLLGGIIASFLFPLIIYKYRVAIMIPEFTSVVEVADAGAVAAKGISFYQGLMIFYLAGILFLLIRLLFRLQYLFRTIKESDIIPMGKIRLVESPGVTSSFSLFNNIFIDSRVTHADREVILNHELAHVAQQHWIDLVLLEMLCIFQWMNPLVWVYSGFIKQNHEYLADRIALQQTSDPALYKACLLNQLFCSPVISLTNSFTFSLNKKRFDMMKKTKRSPLRKMKLTFILPVFAILFYAFAEPEYVIINAGEEGTAQEKVISRLTENPLIVLDGVILDGMMTDFDFTTIDPDDILSINVLKGESAIEKYGEKGREGVIEIYTRGEGKAEPAARPELKKSDAVPQLWTGGTGREGSEGASKVRISHAGEEVTYVVDGKIVSEDDVSEINPDSIGSITVLKGDAASSVYGDEIKNVIVITTKK